MSEPTTTAPPEALAEDQQQWITPLRSVGQAHDRAVRALHAVLLRAAQFETHRRAAAFSLPRGVEIDDIAMHAANDALVLVLAKLDDFEGRSRFTTWAFKFAIHTAGVAVRRHAWADRRLQLPADALNRLTDLASDPAARAEERELLRHIADGVARLTPHQRNVLVSLAVDGVPIDVLAERLSTNRNALYKTLHDARRKLRSMLDEKGVTT